MAKSNKVSKVFSGAWNGFSGIGSWAKASKKAGSKAHRATDHVTPSSKTVANIARNKFGISFPTLESIARTANPERMKSILAAGETGQNQQIMAPLISQAISDKIKGIAAIQTMNSTIISETANASVQIKKSINKASLSNTKHNNQIIEENISQEYALEAEGRRHTHNNQTVIMNAYVGEYLDKSQQRKVLQQKVNDIHLRQIDDDRNYKQQQLQLLQRQGSLADFDLIARQELNPNKIENRMKTLPQGQGGTPIITRAISGIFRYIKGE